MVRNAVSWWAPRWSLSSLTPTAIATGASAAWDSAAYALPSTPLSSAACVAVGAAIVINTTGSVVASACAVFAVVGIAVVIVSASLANIIQVSRPTALAIHTVFRAAV